MVGDLPVGGINPPGCISSNETGYLNVSFSLLLIQYLIPQSSLTQLVEEVGWVLKI